MLRVICAGLPRTGTTSLAAALRVLGYNTLHYAPERLPLVPASDQNWRAYDDVDAVADLPVPLYWRELLEAYPEAKLLATWRPVDEWWPSVLRHSEVIDAEADEEQKALAHAYRRLLYGTERPDWYWWRRRYVEYYNDMVPMMRALSLVGLGAALAIGCGWEPLCDVLGCEVPACEYPWENKRR